MTTYAIVHKDRKHHILFASGFYSLVRAQEWVEDYNPQSYDDKTIHREDLLIIDEKGGLA